MISGKGEFSEAVVGGRGTIHGAIHGEGFSDQTSLDDEDLGLGLGSSHNIHSVSSKNLTKSTTIQNISNIIKEEKILEKKKSSMRMARQDQKPENKAQLIVQKKKDLETKKRKTDELKKSVQTKGTESERNKESRQRELVLLEEKIKKLEVVQSQNREKHSNQKKELNESSGNKLKELTESLTKIQDEIKKLEVQNSDLDVKLSSNQHDENVEEEDSQEQEKYENEMKIMNAKQVELNEQLQILQKTLEETLQNIDKFNSESGDQSLEIVKTLRLKSQELSTKIEESKNQESDLKSKLLEAEEKEADEQKELITLLAKKKDVSELYSTHQVQLKNLMESSKKQEVKVEPKKEEVKVEPKKEVPKEPEYIEKIAKNDPTFKKLSLSNKGLQDSDVTKIFKNAQKNTVLTAIDLSKNPGIKGESIDSVIEFLKCTKTLEELSFDGCPISRPALDKLMKNLAQNYSLTQLYSGTNETDDDINHIEDIMDRNVEKMNK